ncbi:MAG: thiol reductant ABC exporter subunit CydC [Devosia sp.]
MNAILTFAPMLFRLRRALFVSLALSLATIAAGIGLLGLSGWFLTATAITTAGALFNIFGPSAGVRAFAFVRILARYGEKLTGHDTTLRLLSDLRHWLFARLFPVAPLGRRFGRADLVSRLVADVDALDTLFLLSLGPVTTSLATGVAMTAILAILLPGAALWYGPSYALAAIAVPVVLVAASRRLGADVLSTSADLRAAALDSVDCHQDLVVFGGVAQAQARAADAAQRLAGARQRLVALAAASGAAIQCLAAVAIVGTLLAGIGGFTTGAISGPLMVGALLAVVASFEANAMLVRSVGRLAAAAAAAERLRDVADTPPAVVDAGHAASPAGSTLSFERVTFGYDAAATRSVLDAVSFTFHPGECIAIRGPSGSGKSTIANLMVRLADPLAGTIRLGGTDIRDLPLVTLRARISLMQQDAPVFLDSVADNLRIGEPAATDEQLCRALEQVGLADFVRTLPAGLHTLLGEAGRTLSAGQARRLCLARSLLSHTDIVVLDEPTGGLDAEAEAAFLVDLRTIAHGRTMLVITHAELPNGAFDREMTLRAGSLV